MFHFISLGAGVQSSTLALMAAAGEVTPMPDGAIFADTQAEPMEVYRWLDWLEHELPFPVHRVTAGNLREDSLRKRTTSDGREYTRSLVPFFVRNEGGSQGKVWRRSCTRDYKLRPLRRKTKQLAGIRRGKKEVKVTTWIGISLDEMQRMKQADDVWQKNRFPLIELRMTRAGCLEWVRRHGLPEPPRSACTFCPFHDNREWSRLKGEDNASFAEAVAYEAELQQAKASDDNFEGVPFLHRSLVPLEDVAFENDVDPQRMFSWQDECEGMCGV